MSSPSKPTSSSPVTGGKPEPMAVDSSPKKSPEPMAVDSSPKKSPDKVIPPWRSWAREIRDLVIADEDYLFDGKPFNNRWFHSIISRPINNNCELVNSKLHLLNCGWFMKLRRLKVYRLTTVELQRLATHVSTLTDLEIGFLVAPERSETMSEGAEPVDLTVQLPKLERLHLGEILPETARVAFDAKLLDAVYLGNFTIHRVLFDRSPVTHCEFELASKDHNRPKFSGLKTLVCHRILHADNVAVLLSLIRDLPVLAELHCNVAGMACATDRYPNLGDRIDEVVQQLIDAVNKKPTLQIYIQSYPLLGIPGQIRAGFQWAVFACQKAGFLKFEGDHPFRTMQLPWVVRVDYPTLFTAFPLGVKQALFLRVLSIKMPNLQEVIVNAPLLDEPIDSTAFLLFLGAFSGLRKLVFHRTGFGTVFFTRKLPHIIDLERSLVWLEIHEDLNDLAPSYAKLHMVCLSRFRHLRVFGTNLICKKAIPSLFNSVAQFPITFQLRFESAYSTVIFKRMLVERVERVHITIRDHRLGSESSCDYGDVGLRFLTTALDQCEAWSKLLHRFDDIYDLLQDPPETFRRRPIPVPEPPTEEESPPTEEEKASKISSFVMELPPDCPTCRLPPWPVRPVGIRKQFKRGVSY